MTIERPIIRGESEPIWHPCPPSPVWPFRCPAVHPSAGRCGRWRWHKDHHWAPDIDWHEADPFGSSIPPQEEE